MAKTVGSASGNPVLGALLSGCRRCAGASGEFAARNAPYSGRCSAWGQCAPAEAFRRRDCGAHNARCGQPASPRSGPAQGAGRGVPVGRGNRHTRDFGMRVPIRRRARDCCRPTRPLGDCAVGRLSCMRWKDCRALPGCSGGVARRLFRSSARPATFRWRNRATGVRDMATGSAGICAKRCFPDAGRGPSGRRQARHPPNVQRKADQGPFAPHLLLAPRMEPTEPENRKRLFYPLLNDIGRFVWVCRC